MPVRAPSTTPIPLNVNVVDSSPEVDSELKAQFQEWDLEHNKMMERPPKDGHIYLRHARNMLPLLESLAEFHPITKGVVRMFGTVINFQSDRIENDLRVRNVLLTKADMMRVLLDVHLVSQRRQDASVIDSNQRLGVRLLKIADDIKECGNLFDTYHKLPRLARIVNSQEWKNRIAEFNGTFIEHRTALSLLLSVRLVRSVDDLHTKMDRLLSHAFKTKQEWEERLERQLSQYGHSYNFWIGDESKVQILLNVTEDPSIDPSLFRRTDSKQDAQEFQKQRLTTFLASLKDDLGSAVNTLCEKNLSTFTKKLDFHTQRIETAISRSATYVVDQLSGPHGRLHHEDLKELWKEMGWIFCVDIKPFSMALHEYYLDRFSGKAPTVQAVETPNTQKRNEDRWTLEYLGGVYGEEICRAIDRDISGYIRISEVNAFTDEIPEGWTFPQWCVYQAIGWHYEQHIYQKRLQYLLDAFYEVLPHVTPCNRWNVQSTGFHLGLLHNMSRGPKIKPYHFLPPRFMEQILQKIAKQDERTRAGFKTFAHRLVSDDTVQMLFKPNPMDSYILQLCVLIMEQCIDIAHISNRYTVDLLDWDVIIDNINIVRTVVGQRIKGLEATFREKGLNVESEMENFMGGLYRVCYYENFSGVSRDFEWDDIEIKYRRNGFDILDDGPFFLVHQDDPSEILAFPTWESLHPDVGPGEIPQAVWSNDEEVAAFYAPISIVASASCFPHHWIGCNNCGRFPITDMACYHCIDCKDYDLCGECFILPFDSLNVKDGAPDADGGRHLAAHDLIKMTLSVPQLAYHHWVRSLAKFERKSVVQGGFLRHPGPGSSNEEGNQPGRQVLCTQCRDPIVSGPFNKCLHKLCFNFYLCHECEEHHNFPRDQHTVAEYFDVADAQGQDGASTTSHRSWHTLLVVQGRVAEEDSEFNPSGQGITEQVDQMSSANFSSCPTGEDRVARLESRIESLESHMSQLKEMLAELLAR